MASVLMNSCLNAAVREHYMRLPQGDKCLVTYIWINGTGKALHSKTRTMDVEPKSIHEVPEWYNFGSSNKSKDSQIDMYLIPVRMFRDPFNLEPNKLVLCEAVKTNHLATETNHRMSCRKVMDQVKEHHLWFGIEQEYRLTQIHGHPCSRPPNGFHAPQDLKSIGRLIAECHHKACRYAGINIFGTNTEVMPTEVSMEKQHEIYIATVGPCEGIQMGDELWVARFLLHRVCEDFGVVATLNPKPIKGKWNAAGSHTHFSTKLMREEGLQCIERAVEKLSRRHMEPIRVYNRRGGQDNLRRLTACFETSSVNEFSAEIANRGASIRIPYQVGQEKKGCFEELHPAAICDPYFVTEAIASIFLLDSDDEVDD